MRDLKKNVPVTPINIDEQIPNITLLCILDNEAPRNSTLMKLQYYN